MLAVLLAVWLVWLTPSGPLAQEAATLVTHTLPADAKAAVIEWRSSGGQADEASGPDLVVRADGTVAVGSRLTGGRPAEGSILAAQLQELLRFVIDENDFFAYAPGRVARQIEDSQRSPGAAAGTAGAAVAVPLGPPYIDAGTTEITIAADGHRHQVSQHGLFAAAREHPENQALAQLRAIELRLLELAQQIAAAAGR